MPLIENQDFLQFFFSIDLYFSGSLAVADVQAGYKTFFSVLNKF